MIVMYCSQMTRVTPHYTLLRNGDVSWFMSSSWATIPLHFSSQEIGFSWSNSKDQSASSVKVLIKLRIARKVSWLGDFSTREIGVVSRAIPSNSSVLRLANPNSHLELFLFREGVVEPIAAKSYISVSSAGASKGKWPIDYIVFVLYLIGWELRRWKSVQNMASYLKIPSTDLYAWWSL